MKLHLSHYLFRARIVCFTSAVVLTGTSFAESVDSVIFTTHQKGPLNISEKVVVSFENIQYVGNGAAIDHSSAGSSVLSLIDNESVTFYNNMVYSSASVTCGGAIANSGDFRLNANGCVTFCGNTTSSSEFSLYGGAIYNFFDSTFSLNENGDVTFCRNSANEGGSIYNGSHATFTVSGNRKVAFIENDASKSTSCYGGAIYNCSSSNFFLRENDEVLFFGNTSSGGGSAICCSDSSFLDISRNASVIFDSNTLCRPASGTQGGAIDNYKGVLHICQNASVIFNENAIVSLSSTAWGASIANEFGDLLISENEMVSFSRNTSSSSYSAWFASTRAGAIYNTGGVCSLMNNSVLDFVENIATSDANYVYGGAVYNRGDISMFEIKGNTAVSFISNMSCSSTQTALGGALYNSEGIVTLSDNECVSFCENSASGSSLAYGGAICTYEGTFVLRGNDILTFRQNKVYATSWAYGGAVYNHRDSTLLLIENGHVLFEKNFEVSNDTYRLRSIYSEGTLKLSASEGKSIRFLDSVYASGTVNLNQDGTGDIIFTGATTEADLRKVKGGVDGTIEEILNSRTSEIVTNAALYGGRLIVEAGAILKGQGITFTAGADATIRLNGGTLDETGYAIAVSSGSGLEFEGENTLAAASVPLADNSFLSFILDEAQTAVNWNADLDIQGGLSLHLTHEDKPVHDTYALLAMQSGNTVTGWDDAALTISGTTADHLVWENNTLYYRPMLVQENGNTTLDKDVDTDAEGGTIGGKDDVSIDGNGHTLNVKNEVQLVQMALKDGTVKLEGENNGIVSVTLTEGGELVLTAGAGLKTGDIISMVANSKGELVISGDITLDNKGMKGKAGAQTTVSHADAQVLGDATISNVRVEDSTIDLAEGCTVNFEHVILDANTCITDAPAIALLNDVTAELVAGVNVTQAGVDAQSAGVTLVQNDNAAEMLTLTSDAKVAIIVASTFDSLILGGRFSGAGV